MKIAILDDYQDVVAKLECFKLLKEHDVRILTQSYTDEAELAAQLQGTEALVLIRERTPITPTLLERLPELKLISQTGKISNHLDVDQCRAKGVLVAEGQGSPIAPAELTWALIMAASRNLVEYIWDLHHNHWQQAQGLGLGRTLNGLVLGIWGYGKIGQRIARFGEAFGMQVLVWGSETSRSLAQEHGYSAADSKAQLFEQSDILTLHLRLNDLTRQIVLESDLERMKPDSLLVNTSRAELIETNALFRQMYKYPHKRAAVDVYEIEPVIPDETPLTSLPNVLCSPHLGYVEANSYELYFRTAFENVLAFAAGKPTNIAN